NEASYNEASYNEASYYERDVNTKGRWFGRSTMMSRAALGALLGMFVIATGPVQAAGWMPSWRTSGYYYPVTYYYPVAVAVAPPASYCAPTVSVQPATVYPAGPLVYGNGYAQPQPAPPSGTAEPPLANKVPMAPPKVIESKSFAPGNGTGNAKGVKVGFWNISGRDVKLVINGKTHIVPRDRNLTVSVSREFTWQVDGQ